MTEQQQLDPKKVVRFGLIGILIVTAVVLLFMSWQDVAPGEEGFVFRPYSTPGIDIHEVPNSEGTFIVAPWNEMITYNILQQSRSYESQVMDKNGTDIGVVIALNYHAIKGSTAALHLKHGIGYAESFIDKKAKGAIKDVIGRYTYVEAYSTKREILEQEIESILENDFDSNFVYLDFVEIADI
ncbi:MAG: prohibitin 1, partial [Parvicellaceae bacterium]